jgi:predicted CxxxxCH...CXXCH cytochrome family protein
VAGSLSPQLTRGADLLHNSDDTGSLNSKWPNGWGITGGQYGKFVCATCHEPDADNKKNIRSTINTMDGSNWPNGATSISVVFQNATGMGDDSKSRSSSNRVCEVCHSKNRFHNFNTADNTQGLGHPTPKAVCTSCHKHNTGFKAACGGCHGNPPTTNAIGGDYGLVGTPRASNAMQPGQAGAHATHVNGRSMVCDTCHYINNGGIKMPNASGTIQIGFYGFGGKVTSGVYVPYTAANRGYRFASGTANTTIAVAATTYANANKCTNVYCHGGGSVANGKAALGGGSNQTPRWDATGQNSCGSCHGTTAANPPTLGSHTVHAGAAAGYSYYCDLCHPVSGDNSHVQGNVRWALKTADARVGAAATYRTQPAGATGDLAPSASYGECNNIACHSDGKGGVANIAAPTWGNPTGFATCAGCHGGASGSGNSINTDKHGAHINQAALLGSNYGCVDCHARTVSGDLTVANRANHVNQFIDYSGARAGKGSSYTSATGVCASSYCHTDGKGTQMMTPVSGWKSSTTLDCKGCHGLDAAPAFTSVAGEPNYVSSGVNQARSNSHRAHVGNSGQAATCVYCHGATVNSAGTAIIGNHTDRVINVSQGGSKTFTWTGASKSCASISCHGSGSATVQWGQTLASDCTGCHAGNGSAAAILSTGKHTAHVNNAALLGASYGCVDCHALTVADDRNIATPALHADGFKQYSGLMAGKNSSYSTVSGICSASYCHSDGKGTQSDMSASGWKTGATLDCKGCHGGDAAPAFVSAAGEPNYANAGADQPRSNSHQKHVGTSGQAATCVYCHGATVSSAGTAIVGNHTNRVIEVVAGGGKSFTPGGGKSCSSISCHGAGAGPAIWGQTFPVDCTGCHGGNNSAAVIITSNRHLAHVSNATVIGTNLTCVECHALTVSSDRAIANVARHGDGLANYSGARGGRNSSACNAAYCHSDGKGAAGQTVSWTSGPALDCKGCHGADAAPDFAAVAGEPNYVNAGVGLSRANSHKAHTQSLLQKGAASCEICHFSTVTTAGTELQGSGLHLNGTINVTFNTAKAGATAGYDNGTRTCSNILCHGGGSPRWGDTAGAGCNGCHPNLSATHALHIGDLASAGTVSFYNFTANRSTGSVYRFGCANCHPTDSANHRNGQVNITLNKDKIGGSGLIKLNNLNASDSAGYTRGGANSITCETVYCHSNGRTNAPLLSDYRQTPDWYGGSFGANRCGGCHDNPPQYSGQSHYNPSSTIGDNGRPPYLETGHMVGIHFRNTIKGNGLGGFLGFSSAGSKAHGNPALATTISCYLCHSGIVSSSQIDSYAMNGTTSMFRCGNCHTAGTPTPLQAGSITDTSRHINGAKNVAFAPVTFKTKAQLANVANAQGWSRNGNYKAADSYDSFDLGASTWDPATRTCLTACHVNQPNITWGAALSCESCHANQ